MSDASNECWSRKTVVGVTLLLKVVERIINKFEWEKIKPSMMLSFNFPLSNLSRLFTAIDSCRSPALAVGRGAHMQE